MTLTPGPILSLHRPHAISGVSVAGARAAALRPNGAEWRPVVVGTDLTPASLAASPLAACPSLELAPLPAGLDPAAQCLHLAGHLAALEPSAIVPNDQPLGFAAASLLRTPCAAWCHGDDLLALELYERCLPLADSAAAVNSAIAAKLAPLSRTPVHTLPAPLSVPDHPLPPPHRTGTLKLAYIGWLENRNKRALDLALLARELFARGVPFELKIAGDGPCRQQLAASLADLPATLLGPLAPAAAHDLICWCDALVLVSRSEGWPLVAMEAAAAGRALALTSTCGGASELFAAEGGALLAPTGDMPSLADQLAHAFSSCRLELLARAAHAAARTHLHLSAAAPRFNRFIAAAAAGPRDAAHDWNHVLLALDMLGQSSADNLTALRDRFAKAHNIPAARLDLRTPAYLTPQQRLFLRTLGHLSAQGHRRIALFGAGRHTRRLAPLLHAGAVVGLIDDRAPTITNDFGLPLVTPAEAHTLRPDAILISSDEHEEHMVRSARSWARKLPIIGMYSPTPLPEGGAGGGFVLRQAS